jgi:prepilin peptidase CpaA
MSLLTLLQTGCLAALAMLLIAVGWQDLRTLRIANGLSLATVAVFAVWAAAGFAMGRMPLVAIGVTVACAVGVFAVGVAGFAAGILGGGDVKMLTATSLFAGPSHLIDFLVVTALAGGALGLALLAGASIGPSASTACTVRARVRISLPYGPAIAAGGLWVITALYAS